ncbi:MAG: hypothetical protein ACP5MV_04355 [Candidatus Parvarchaeum sp.]
MDDSTGVQTNPTSIQLGPMPKGSKKHRYVAIAAIIVLAVFLIFIFASYRGYIPFLKVSAASNPYYSVSNFNQLASVSSKLSNTSGPFNMSYSFLLSLGAKSGSSVFSFNLPINGYLAHYKPYNRVAANVDLGTLVKDIASLGIGINTSSFPSAFNTINLTLLSNVSYDTLCIPFSMIASAEKVNLSDLGAALNDSAINSGSLMCFVSKTSGLKNSSSLANLSSINNSLMQYSNYLQVKFLKGETYNGNSCSLLNINTTSAFQSKYNASMGFSFCFSNVYGVPLYGSFILNLTKDSSTIMKIFNSSASNLNVSSLVLSATLKSSFNPIPSSASSLISFPVGSYTFNENQSTQALGQLIGILSGFKG